MEKDFKEAKYIVWLDYGYEGWKPIGFDNLSDAAKHEAYGSSRVITREVIDWEAVAKCPYPDCPKVKYKECPTHGL